MTININEKLGSLLILGFEGESVTSNHPIIKDIGKYKLGGVILFDRLLARKRTSNNITSKVQVKRLTADLQASSSDKLLICVDQEGGMVNRFKKERGFPVTGSAYELSSDPTFTKTRQAAKATATMLAELGINFNMAPVADLNSYPKNPVIGKYNRSFSADPNIVVNHAKIWIEEHRQLNILSCLKHFPGHGSARADTHEGFVDISTSWHENELLPYQLLNKSGLVDAVMTGHLFNTNHDTQYPATLSKSTIKNLLRNSIGYNGPLLSDDMQMGAIIKHYGLEEACCKAIISGVDLLVIGNNLVANPNIAQKLIDTLKSKLDHGSLTMERVDEAWMRVQTLKQKLGDSSNIYTKEKT